MERQDEPAKLQVSTLPNGVRILTESTVFPSTVTLGVSIGAGTRDEDMDHSGICHAFKNTFLKTNVRTNEQLNYCMIQMGGGEFSMKYDQESMLYSGSFLAHDTYDFMQMTADMVLDDKTVIDEEAAQWRADEYFKLRALTATHATNIEDQWLTAAYGLKDLGMPLAGFQSKFQNIGYSHLNHFRQHFATPDRMVVMGLGVNNHEEFVTAVAPYFQHLTPAKAHARHKAQYVGGELRSVSDEENTTIHLSFLGPDANNHEDQMALKVLKRLVGTSCTKSTPGVHRAYTHFIQKYPFISCLNWSFARFSDASNFGLNISGASEKAGQLADALTTELQDLAKVSDQEVDRAKKDFLRKAGDMFATPQCRAHKYSSQLWTLGEARTLDRLQEAVKNVTAERVRSVAANLIKTAPTLIVQGGNTHEVPSADKFHARLK
jgi:predicted Zn-dependent peptidase